MPIMVKDIGANLTKRSLPVQNALVPVQNTFSLSDPDRYTRHQRPIPSATAAFGDRVS